LLTQLSSGVLSFSDTVRMECFDAEWVINGVPTDRLICISPEQLAIDNSLRTAENEAAFRRYREDFEQDLLNTNDWVLNQFKDRMYLLHWKDRLKGSEWRSPL
jgi:hypothetical protein